MSLELEDDDDDKSLEDCCFEGLGDIQHTLGITNSDYLQRLHTNPIGLSLEMAAITDEETT